jgi:hypothetical protein
MAYATLEELQDYLGVNQVLPEDASRLLERASELIDYFVTTRFNPEDPETSGVLSKSACAQVEFWLLTEESHAILAQKGETSIGSLRFQNPDQLAPRARMYLSSSGLLNRSLSLRTRHGVSSELAQSFFDPQKNPQKRY